MDQILVASSGLDHITEQIFGYLDTKTLLNCRFLSKRSKNLIDSSKPLISIQIKWMKTKTVKIQRKMYSIGRLGYPVLIYKTIIDLYPHWNYIFDKIEDKLNLKELRQMFEFMKRFFAIKDFRNDTFIPKSKVVPSPVHFAAKHGNTNIFKLFGKFLIDYNATDEEGCTPLHYAFANGRMGPIYHLLWMEGMPNVQDKHGMTPLHYGCKNGHYKVIELCFVFHPDFDFTVKDFKNRSLLHFACMSGNKALLEMMLTIELFNLNEADDHGWTPLHYACKTSNSTMIKYLMKQNRANIDFNLQDRYGRTPYTLTYFNGNSDARNLILNHCKSQNIEVDGLKSLAESWICRPEPIFIGFLLFVFLLSQGYMFFDGLVLVVILLCTYVLYVESFTMK